MMIPLKTEERYLLAVFLPLLFLSVWSLFNNIGSFDVYTMWGDRDMWRAATLGGDEAPLGPESNAGLRAPGKFFYDLLRIGIDAFGGVGVNIALNLLYAAAALVILIATHAHFGALPAVLSAVLFLTAGANLEFNNRLWNPGFIPFFAAVSTFATFYFLKTGKAVFAFLVFLSASAAVQIHAQMMFLMGYFFVAALVYRRRISPYAMLAIFLGVVIPSWEFLLWDAANGFQYLNASFGGAVDLYTEPDAYAVEQKTDHDWVSFIGNRLEHHLPMYASIISNASHFPGEWFSGALSFFPPGKYISIVFDVLILTSIGLFIWIVRKSILSEVKERTPGIGFFVLLIASAFVVYLGAGIHPRHIYFLAPSIALLSACSLLFVYRRIASRWDFEGGMNFTGLAARAVLLGVITFPAVVVTGIGFTSTGSERDRYKGAEELAHHVYAHHMPSWEDFAARTVVVNMEPETMRTVLYRRLLAYAFTMTKPAERTDVSSPHCLVVVNNFNDLDRSVSEIAAAVMDAEAFRVYAPTLVATSTSKNFLFLAYETPHGNCPTNVENAYFPTRFEREHLEPKRVMSSAIIYRTRRLELDPERFRSLWHVEEKTEAGKAVFVLHQPPFSFPMGIEISHGETGSLATLHGRLLRGKTGLPRRELKSPYLRIVDTASGQETIVPFLRGAFREGTVLGAVRDHVYAPLRVKLPQEITSESVVFFGAEEDPFGKWELQLTR